MDAIWRAVALALVGVVLLLFLEGWTLPNTAVLTGLGFIFAFVETGLGRAWARGSSRT